MASGISPCLIKKFSPLKDVASQHIAELIKHCEILSVVAGAFALKQKEVNRYKCFLVCGQVEIRRSFHERIYPHQDSPECHQPLNDLLSGAGVVKAKSDCQILRVNTEALERLLHWSEPHNYHIAHLGEGESSLDYQMVIDDSYQDDWAESFLQSSLAASLNLGAITELMRELDDIEIKAGSKVIEQHRDGDFFYIVKQGEARVLLDRFGPQRGQFIDLSAGRYFGDEALVANTPRNASVVMKTDGILGRVNRDVFDTIIKDNLISSVTVQEVAKMRTDEYHCVDVRFSMEHPHTDYKRSFNIPITHLRQRLNDLETQFTYIVGPEGDQRSVLGTYLLRQAGYQAYYLAA